MERLGRRLQAGASQACAVAARPARFQILAPGRTAAPGSLYPNETGKAVSLMRIPERKVRTPQGRMPHEAQAKWGHRVSRPGDGQCHRKQTAPGKPKGIPGVMVKRWGKSPPRRPATATARKTPSGARQNRRLDGPSHSRGYAASPAARKGQRRTPAPQGIDERNDGPGTFGCRTKSGLQPRS